VRGGILLQVVWMWYSFKWMLYAVIHCGSEKYWTGTVAVATYDSLRPPIRIRRTALTGEGNLLPAHWTLVHDKLAVTATYVCDGQLQEKTILQKCHGKLSFSLCDVILWGGLLVINNVNCILNSVELHWKLHVVLTRKIPV